MYKWTLRIFANANKCRRENMSIYYNPHGKKNESESNRIMTYHTQNYILYKRIHLRTLYGKINSLEPRILTEYIFNWNHFRHTFYTQSLQFIFNINRTLHTVVWQFWHVLEQNQSNKWEWTLKRKDEREKKKIVIKMNNS